MSRARPTGEVHPVANLFPLIEGAELDALAEDVRANGLLEAVWIDAAGVLLDGRNRLRACAQASVEPRWQVYEGADPVGFIVSLNLKRRHLSAGQKAALAADLLPFYEDQAQERSRSNLKQNRVRRSAQSEPEGRSDERAAKAVGASGRAVAQFKRVAEQAPDLADKVRSGDLAVDRAERIVRDREAAENRASEAKALAAASPIALRLEVHHGDFREVLAELENVDAIITDPPYAAEYLPLLEDLAGWADKVLGPDGVLAVLMGQTHLPEVYRLLDGHRPYRWTACYLTPGNGYASHARKVQSNWKPLLVYGGGPRFGDVIRSEGADADAKDRHKWGQDYGAIHTIVERFTSEGQTVVDPFMGSGTTLVAAHALGRHAVGCDLDEEAVQTARGWLA